MIERRKLTILDKLKIMVRQANCTACGLKLGKLEDCEYDHQHSLGMGGTDTLDNLFAKHVDCHKAKTKRDSHARAKVRHIAKKASRFQPLPTGSDIGMEIETPASVKPKNLWAGRKLQSRGFEKRIT